MDGAHRTVNAAAPAWQPPWNGSDEQWLDWANAIPLVHALGVTVTELTAASATCVVPEVPIAPNPNGAVNGGLVVAIVDQLMAMVAIKGGQEGLLPATGSLHTQFHSPSFAPLTITASVLGGGRRVTFVEAVVRNAQGQRTSTSQATMVAGGSVRA